MIDREKVLTVLRRRFPGAGPDVLAAAANAIVGLPEEWEEVSVLEPQVAARLAGTATSDSEQRSRETVEDVEFRVYRRRLR